MRSGNSPGAVAVLTHVRTLRYFACLILLSAAVFAQRRGGPPGSPGQTAVAVPQPPATPDEKKASVSGRVVNALTGEPLKKAEVTLRRNDAGRSPATAFVRYTATTDTQGAFSIVKIEPGEYRLSSKRTGFLTGEYGTPIKLGEKQNTTDLLVKLTRQAVLSGTVLDDDGDPLEGATVQVFTPSYKGGKRVLTQVDSGETDDRGLYRIPDIPPGKYIIYANAPSASGFRRGGGPPMPRPQESVSDTGLAAAYYPGVTDESQAAKLDVTAGSDIAGLDIRLTKTRMYKVSGRVLDAAGTGGARGAMLALYNAGSGSTRLRSFVRGGDGSFEILNVPAGSYILMVNAPSQDRRSSPMLMPVDVRGNVENLSINVGPGQAVSGSVTVDAADKPSLTGMTVNLAPSIPVPMSGAYARVQNDGSFKLDSVQPGKYIVSVTGLPAGSYVQSIMAGSVDVLATELDCSGGVAGNIQVTLSMAGGQVSGAVQNKDAPAPGATVVLVPDESRRAVGMFYKTGTTDQTGAFTVKGVPPGDYTVYAWEAIESGAWQNPDIMKLVDGRGERVKVAKNGSETVQLKLIPEMKD